MAAAKKTSEGEAKDTLPICGIVRPIADMGDYTFAHWEEVHAIISEAAADAGYKPRLVSENESVGVILSNIVSNLFSDPIVICDVSGKNPNVMFELGMRIAFEKPVIIITDDATSYSFDISPVKHLTYPRSLRYEKINSFKADLAAAIVATVAARNEPDHKGYLQQFGPIKVADLAPNDVSMKEVIEGLRDMSHRIRAIEKRLDQKGMPDLRNRAISVAEFASEAARKAADPATLRLIGTADKNLSDAELTKLYAAGWTTGVKT